MHLFSFYSQRIVTNFYLKTYVHDPFGWLLQHSFKLPSTFRSVIVTEVYIWERSAAHQRLDNISVCPKSTYWNPVTSVIFRKWLGLAGGDLVNSISALVRGVRELSSSPPSTQEGAVSEPHQMGPHHTCRSWPSISQTLELKTEIEFCLLNYSVYNVFIKQPK